MRKPPRKHSDDLKAINQLAMTATSEIVDAVEKMHHAIASGPELLGQPFAGPARLFTRLAYAPTRQIARWVGLGLEGALTRLAPLLGSSAAGPRREALLAVLNGVVGDHLAETQSPLAIPMGFRKNGIAFALDGDALQKQFPRATSRLLVQVHGSSLNDLHWDRDGHGAALARELGYSVVSLHYNSGLHISQNGRAFAALLDQLSSQWPTPLEQIHLLGHSMGGLIARSAAHLASEQNLSWRRRLRTLITLGSPHHGAVLEQGGNWIDALLGVSAYSAPIGKLARLRSAGVTDLRFGHVLDEHWQGRDRFAFGADSRRPLPLPTDVECYAIAATTAPSLTDKLPGDGLVSVDSALGRHARADLTLGFPESHLWIARGTRHVELLSSPAVYAQLQKWLGTLI